MKQVPQTKKVKDLISTAIGSETVDFEKLAVFETIAINTLPLNKGGVYNGAVLTRDTIKQMEAYLNKENFVPLHLNHQQSRELPVGRSFAGKMGTRPGKGGREISELSVLFYLSKGTELGASLIDGLDTGIINEVSIGIYPKTVKCSKCEFDYIKDGSFLNWVDATCANGHKIGDKGVHAILDGLSKFMELSLVSLGAADHARIKSGETSIMASFEEEEIQTKLAASSTKESLTLLVATKSTELNMQKLNACEITELKDDLNTRGKDAVTANYQPIVDMIANIGDEITVDQVVELRKQFTEELAKFAKTTPPEVPSAPIVLTLDALVEAKSAQKIAENKLAEISATAATLTSELSAAKAEIDQLKVTNAQVTSLSTDNNEMKEFLKLSCQSLLIATGISNGVVPESVTDLIGTIKQAQAKLSKLPVGGLGASADLVQKPEPSVNKSLDAFTTKK